MVNVGDTIQCDSYEDAINVTVSLEDVGYKTSFRMKGLKAIVTVIDYEKPVRRYRTKRSIDVDMMEHEARMQGLSYGEYMKKLEIEKIRKARNN